MESSATGLIGSNLSLSKAVPKAFSGQDDRKNKENPLFSGGGLLPCDTKKANSCGKTYKFNLRNSTINPFVINGMWILSLACW
jgi:hypothetical protein